MMFFFVLVCLVIAVPLGLLWIVWSESDDYLSESFDFDDAKEREGA